MASLALFARSGRAVTASLLTAAAIAACSSEPSELASAASVCRDYVAATEAQAHRCGGIVPDPERAFVDPMRECMERMGVIGTGFTKDAVAKCARQRGESCETKASACRFVGARTAHSPCWKDEQCASGYCARWGSGFTWCGECFEKVRDTIECEGDDECPFVGDFCKARRCTPRYPLGYACEGDDECRSTYCEPSAKQCAAKQADAIACNLDVDCQSNYCEPISRVCTKRPKTPSMGDPNDSCNGTNAPCLRGPCNLETKRCPMPVGSPCKTSGDCQEGVCVRRACQRFAAEMCPLVEVEADAGAAP